jgi:hypothetical protein
VDSVEVPSWRIESGPFIAIPDDSLVTAMIVPGIEDSADATGGLTDTVTIDLFSTAGKVGSAVLMPSTASRIGDQCQAWPSVRVRRTSSRPPRWNMGFAAARVLPFPMDSLARLPRSDSARLVSEIARLSSTVPHDTSLIFRGLPFRVQSAYFIRTPDGEMLVVATVIRNINQEASARAEHLLLIAGHPGSDQRAPFVLRYFERSSGPEESAETAEVLGTVLMGAEQRPTIVIGRSDDAGIAFSLVERDDRGGWALRWTTAFTDC